MTKPNLHKPAWSKHKRYPKKPPVEEQKKAIREEVRSKSSFKKEV